jgi:hypothetical protein
MMAHNAASKYLETHPTQEYINAKNYLDKADAAYNAAQQAAGDANCRWTAMFDRRAQESASAALARNSPPRGSPEKAARLDVTVAYTVKEAAYAECLRAKTNQATLRQTTVRRRAVKTPRRQISFPQQFELTTIQI